MMTKIYTQAVNVRICIEDAQQSANYGPLFDWLQDSRDPGTEPYFPTNLKRLISLRYFQRVWVIQEVALARKAYLHVNFTEMLLSLPILRYIQKRYPTQATGGVLSWDTSFKIKADLVICLRAGIGGQCTDPKDKVFAVLGLMEPVARSLIPVDYSLSIEELYAYVNIAIVKIYKKMDILRDILHCSGQGLQMGEESFRRILTTCQAEATSRPRGQFSDNVIGPWSYDTDIRAISSSVPFTTTENPVAATVATQGPMINTHLGSPLPLLQVRGHLIDIVAYNT
jgi:hypothetical protein